jgi:hypothetical protein
MSKKMYPIIFALSVLVNASYALAQEPQIRC